MFSRSMFWGFALVVATTGAAQAQFSPGDMNCDMTVDGLDVGAFVLALIDPSGYAAAYPGCPLSNADFDCDASAGVGDIAAFVDCLLTGNCPPCGACCHTDGDCTLTLETDCTGMWQGAGTDCDPNPCPPPDLVIDTVTVGNPGNPADTRYETPGHGRVDYTFNIGKHEVTAGQYCAFLNAVAATDTYGLYNTDMWTIDLGCKIERSGTSGSYTYSVAEDWANRPVNYVSWGDAARFANWLHNGQPTGVQDQTTTEDGSYYLNGATSDAVLIAIVREPDATWVLPSEDEWYKAAYHKNDGVTGNYWDFPASSGAVPSNQLIDPDPGNNANFYQNGYTIGSPYYRTEVGEFENSDGPYGTFDQGGNVWEWNEAIVYGSYRGLRGGSFSDYEVACLHAGHRNFFFPSYELSAVGFRVSEVH